MTGWSFAEIGELTMPQFLAAQAGVLRYMTALAGGVASQGLGHVGGGRPGKRTPQELDHLVPQMDVVSMAAARDRLKERTGRTTFKLTEVLKEISNGG